MHPPLPPLYTNDASPEFLRNLDESTFTEAEVAGFAEESREAYRKNEAYIAAHPAIGIHRPATEGSQSREGGVITQASSALSFSLDDGRELRIARKGDRVTYPDGRTAHIVTGAGEANSDLALVGSRLSNGDEIINTLHAGFVMVVRDGVPKAADFLPPVDA
ncbi:PAAR domain-containing protein [Xanthomonas sp. WHRI 1810A]|uniref:PAAR domain-containing protein n=1 Tax=Xanthomonas sp. WHRI 1810A TaxID=3161565 RepID=UPI0032E84F39